MALNSELLLIPLNWVLILKVHEVALKVLVLVSTLLLPEKFMVVDVAFIVPLLVNVDWKPNVNVLLVNFRSPLLVKVFRLLPAIVTAELAGKVILLFAPITSEVL